MKSHCLLTALLFIWTSSISTTWATAAESERLDDRYLKKLLLRIHDKTGMSIPDIKNPHFPSVEFASQQLINEIVCKNKNCNAQAATKDTTIFLLNGLDVNTVEGESILYHELVHTLQFHNFGKNLNCKSWLKREVQAYQLQDEFVSAKGLHMPWLKTVPRYLTQMCPK
ncbi:MAG: DUF4157 domain-containing protein [Proteobacteria bacterium]|nr:DUF4157 domain-containing protein [Pseudomonadota bacterium]MDA1332320.1 DUF4157 domain-containing protein [Pseudomonadota bacterium]